MADIEVRASGQTINASVLDRIAIRLPENASTGYQWSITHIDENLQVEADEFVLPEPMAPGAAGERLVVVRPRRSGHARLALQLKRAWEVEPIERFELDLSVI